MKLLSKEEKAGIDSTSKTIKKWDEFLKKAVWNLGYKQELIDNMYPYSKGIPLLNGEYLPVDSVTGRAFFKMSLADKMCAVLSAFSDTETSGTRAYDDMKSFVCDLWRSDEAFFNRCFKEKSQAEYIEGSEKEEHFREFIMNSDVMYFDLNIASHYGIHWLTDEEKEQLTQNRSVEYYVPGGKYFVLNKALADVYDYTPSQSRITSLAAGKSNKAYNTLDYFAEVYLQNYLVLSLNPIDKFMCSTKQAFGSCMSIAKQNDTRGTNSTPAFGLPALFPFDSVFMLFMTPGKHKNMYWETEEWEKEPSERDPEKAYKYLKMTCRSLTYKGYIAEDLASMLKNVLPNNIENEEQKEWNRAIENQEYLYIGRQYSAKGEDFVWQYMISILLAKHGIATSMGYLPALNKTKEWGYPISTFGAKNTLCGTMKKEEAPIVVDRFGFIRGIYYDNLSFSFTLRASEVRSSSGYINPFNKNESQELLSSNASIHIGSSRTGIGSASCYWTASGIDMFKMMLGQQNYTMFNRNVRICSECGELIQGGGRTLSDGKFICSDCIEKLGYKICKHCQELYKPEQAQEHEEFNLRELTNPDDYDKFEPIIKCRSQLSACSSRNRTRALCIHCGYVYPIYDSSALTTISWKGFDLLVTICSKCMKKAVMCEKCKRIIFLEDTSDAVLLLPNRRIICSDCIESIRIRQEVRKNLMSILENLTEEDITSERTDEQSVVSRIGHLIDINTRLQFSSNIKKDIYKQIQSFLSSHPEMNFVKIAPNKPELPSEQETRSAGNPFPFPETTEEVVTEVPLPF